MTIASRLTPPDLAARLAARQRDGKRPQIMSHRWEALLFLHWRLPAERMQSTLPQGLVADTFGGEAYLGITPFFMRNVRLVGTPALPWFSDFQELNVRTYVFDAAGTPGIWFYSLECNQALAAWGARLITGLPYLTASMTAQRAEFIEYSSQRAGCSEARYRYRGTGVLSETVPGSLEFFLLERYYLFSRRRHLLIRQQVSHAPYQYREAEVTEYSAIPAHLDEFTELTEAPVHTCFVDGFDVRVYGTQSIGSTASRS